MELISNQHLKSMCLLKIFWLSFCNFDTKEWLGSRFYNCYSQVQSDICSDLQVLGFGEYIEDVYTAYEQHKLETMVIYTPPLCTFIFCKKIILNQIFPRVKAMQQIKIV